MAEIIANVYPTQLSMRNYLLRFSILIIGGLFALSCQTTETVTDPSADEPEPDYSTVITADAVTSSGVVDVHHVGIKSITKFLTPCWGGIS